MTTRDEDVAIRERFDQPQVAAEYQRRKNQFDTDKNRREMRCIETALDTVPPDSLVLDLPTGTGRLIPMLLKRGLRVVAADYSNHMLEKAKDHVKNGPHDLTADDLARVEYLQLDIMNTSLPENYVDVCISNRLFHHYPTSLLRQRALCELVRITRSKIILSYFSNVAFSAMRFHLKNALLRRNPNDRVPIWPSVMFSDIACAGAVVEETFPVRYGLSPQTYLRVGIKNGGENTLANTFASGE